MKIEMYGISTLGSLSKPKRMTPAYELVQQYKTQHIFFVSLFS